MKKLFVIAVFVSLLIGCTTKPEIIDNGQPGQIRVMVFLDENRNGKLDQGESGISEKVGISQDISCPAGNMNKVTQAETDINGETVFSELKPGVYCVALLGNRVVSTKLTQEIPLSSEQEKLVYFGITE
jgi:uncharacterized protein (DUF2141 family)